VTGTSSISCLVGNFKYRFFLDYEFGSMDSKKQFKDAFHGTVVQSVYLWPLHVIDFRVVDTYMWVHRVPRVNAPVIKSKMA
jgi:hypothetical protein